MNVTRFQELIVSQLEKETLSLRLNEGTFVIFSSGGPLIDVEVSTVWSVSFFLLRVLS